MLFFSDLSKNILKNTLLILFPLIFLSCSASQRYKTIESDTSTPFVRILLNEPSGNLSLTAGDEFTLLSGDKKIKNITKGEFLTFSPGKKVVYHSGSRTFESEKFLIHTDQTFHYDNRQVTGNITITSDDKSVYLVNSVPLEEYLKGVIPSEMPLGSGNEYFEGLKAFAIIARTYTLQRLSIGGSFFDVRTDVRDQVYGGVSNRREISDRAVDETKGIILTYKNKPATVFYSSTCGGITEEVQNVFGNQEIPYMTNVEDGNPSYCNVSPRYNWEEKFSSERVVALLKKAAKISNGDYVVKDIRINTRFKSGRVNELEILLNSKSGSSSVKLYGNNIRFVLLNDNNRTLNSNKFEVIKNKEGYLFKGMGSGHGVGMCQWGTLNQSTQGITYDKIIIHYFPGTELTEFYD